ncbi:MAG: ATP-binding protein [Bacteroidota bacterium]
METIDSLKSTIKKLKEELALEKSRNIVNTSVLEGSNLIVWSVNMDFELISFNQNYFRELFTHDNNSKVTYFESDTVKTLKSNKFWKQRYRKATKGYLLNFEIQLTKNDRELWKGVFLNPTYDNQGKIIAVSGVAYDITEKMQSRIDLQESERKFRTIFESFQDLYFRCTLDGKITMLSPSVRSITGFKEAELLGKNITNFYIYNQRTKSLLKKLANAGKVQNLEFDLIHKTGKKIACNCNLNLVFDDLNPSYIEGVARDISLLKQTNLQLKDSKAELEKSLKIKERFLANMSHEIRTPLNGIMGMAHLLSESRLDDLQTKHVNSLRSSAEILLDLLNDLLDISKIEAGKMELNVNPVSLRELVNKLKHLYGAQAIDNQIKIRFSLDEKIPEVVLTDEIKLLQIFSNLISNGIKFTHRGGKVSIAITLEKIKGSSVWLRGSIEDDGIGISKKDQKRLFKSFSQLDSSNQKSYKGTGLGLHLSKNLVKLFGGNIYVQSEKGRGSKFWFTFKAQATDTKWLKKTEKSLLKFQKPSTVLVVDDNAINLQLASEILIQAGAKVKTAVSGFEALRVCCDNVFDVIIMDIQMPGMDGLLTTQKLRSEMGVTSPIIAMTAYTRGEKFDRQGLQDYIAKPIDPVNLIKTVERWLNTKTKERPYSEEPKAQSKAVLNRNVLDKLISYGGVEMVDRALQEFEQELDNQLDLLERLFKLKKYQKASEILHTIKGNAGTLGIEQIASWAEHMEELTKTKKYTTFGIDLGKLRLLFDSLQNEVRR